MRIRNILLLHVYGILGFLLLMKMFSVWHEDTRWRVPIRWAVVVVLIFWVVAKVFIEPISQPPSYTESAFGLLAGMVALVTLVHSIRLSIVGVFQDIRSWTSIGVLINNVGNLPLYALSTKIVVLPTSQWMAVWSLHWLISIIVNMCFMTAFLCIRRH